MNKHVQLTDNPLNENSASLLLSVLDSSDLFDSPHAWRDTPVIAFSSWLSSQPLAESTKKVRLAMWGKFLRYLSHAGLTLADCDAQHIAYFITSFGLEKEQGWRYVKLIERVYVHLNGLGVNSINPARSAGKKGVNTRRNDPMRFLGNEEKQKLTKFLSANLLAIEEAHQQNKIKKMKKNEFAVAWARARDIAMVAVLYGAGMKVSELVRLSVSCTSYQEGVLVLPRLKFEMERRIKLMPLAIEALRVWMLYREPDIALGLVLFPSVVAKRRDDQRTRTSAMHPSTVFRRTKGLLEVVGIYDARTCCQTLRNSYAGHLIDTGATDDDLNEAMGFVGDFSASKVRLEYARFKQRDGMH